MRNLRGFEVGLSLVFGCLLLGLVAELYYLLWWKKRSVSTESEAKGHEEVELEMGSGKDLLLKAFGEESIESELMRLHNLAGPPRFLFTIKEETKEDLETESVKSRTRSLSDLVMAEESPFLTPLSSPIKSSPSLYGFNPLFETSASPPPPPPPKFKFLRDAEEKLQRRLEEESEKRVSENGGLVSCHQDLESKDESFVNKNIENLELQQQQQQQRCCSVNVVTQKCSSQVLPLPSSPTTLSSTLHQKPIVH